MPQDEKTIQKYPELAECKSKKEYADRVLELYPVLPNATLQQQQQRLDAVVEAVTESPFHSEEEKQDLRNQTWEQNHARLTVTIYDLVQEMNQMPSINQLSQKSGLGRQTVRKHLKEFHQSANYQHQVQQLRMLSSQVVVQLFKLAMQGNVKAAKVYLDAVGGLPGVEETQPAKASQQTNYIQVNNSLKIDQVTFMNLPESIQQQISDLIQQGLQPSPIAGNHR